VQLNLYRGNIDVAGRSSPNNLYDEGIATMEGGGELQSDRRGRVFADSGLAQPRTGEAASAGVLDYYFRASHGARIRFALINVPVDVGESSSGLAIR